MAKQIQIDGWVSIVPSAMYDSWVAKKWIKKGASAFSGTDNKSQLGYIRTLEKKGKRKHARTLRESRYLQDKKWVPVHNTWIIKEEDLEKIHEEISTWYSGVFNYVETWLKEHKYIDLASGSFLGGFCAETDPEHEVVKKWGAPLANKMNKVAQIKEKFGYIVVYFNGLTDEEQKEIENFAKEVETKYDCLTRFN